MPTVPVWDAEWAHTNVCVWDVAAAHLCAESALEKRGDEVGGEAFLVTGSGPAWKMQNTRDALQVGHLLHLRSIWKGVWYFKVSKNLLSMRLISYLR